MAKCIGLIVFILAAWGLGNLIGYIFILIDRKGKI